MCQDLGLRPNIITKDVPITPFSQEIVRVLGALCQDLGVKARYTRLIMLQYHNVHNPYHTLHTRTESLECSTECLVQQIHRAVSGRARAPCLTCSGLSPHFLCPLECLDEDSFTAWSPVSSTACTQAEPPPPGLSSCLAVRRRLDRTVTLYIEAHEGRAPLSLGQA